MNNTNGIDSNTLKIIKKWLDDNLPVSGDCDFWTGYETAIIDMKKFIDLLENKT